MQKRKKRKYEVNKGKVCKTPGCNFTAKIKGYCNCCYTKNYQRMTYKKAGVDIEKEERAIKEILSSIKSQSNVTLGGHYAGLIRFDINQKGY